MINEFSFKAMVGKAWNWFKDKVIALWNWLKEQWNKTTTRKEKIFHLSRLEFFYY